MSQPEPVELRVCTVCAEPWHLHLAFAHYRLFADEEEGWNLEATDSDVTTEDCVRALRKRNQGPSGPPGPMGPMGPRGNSR